MGSPFEDALAAASPQIDETFAESWLCIPYAAANGDVNGRPAPDPDRPSQEFPAFFVDPYARGHSGETRVQGVKNERPGHTSSRPQINFDARNLPYALRAGDQVKRCTTSKIYRVAEVKPLPAGSRMRVDLNEL
jgi:hypothetical protein